MVIPFSMESLVGQKPVGFVALKFWIGAKLILWPFYLHNEISYTGKMTC